MTMRDIRSANVRVLCSAVLVGATLFAACEAKVPHTAAMTNHDSTEALKVAERTRPSAANQLDAPRSVFTVDSIVVRAANSLRTTRLAGHVISGAGIANVDVRHPLRTQVLQADTFPHSRNRVAPFAGINTLGGSLPATKRSSVSMPISLTHANHVTARNAVFSHALIGKTLNNAAQSDTTKKRRWIAPCADRSFVVSDLTPCPVALRPLLMLDDAVIADSVQDTLRLDPDAISRVEVLKGPAATALSADPRARNGVIRIWFKNRER